MTKEEFLALREDILARRDEIEERDNNVGIGRSGREMNALLMFDMLDDYLAGKLTKLQRGLMEDIVAAHGLDLDDLRHLPSMY